MPAIPSVANVGQVSPELATERLARWGFRERLGLAGGRLLAPLTAKVSAARHARMFHPDGVVYTARVVPCRDAQDLGPFAQRLSGSALVRFSSALWRGNHEWPDVLGVAIRFLAEGHAPGSEQDLLLATIRFPWTMPFAPLATNFRSFLWNHYHAVSPFEADGIGPLKLRLRSPRLHNASTPSRVEHLQQEVAAGHAVFELQARHLDVSLLARHWFGVARLELTAPLEIDQAALRFSPFHAGRGLFPLGFVHALRAGAYAASQAARADDPSRER